MKTESNALPPWAQWASGIGLMAVALTAGGLSLAVNVLAGLGVGVAVAVAYGLSDVGKMLLPVVCSGIGWNRHTRTAYIVTSIVSVLCAATYLADQHGSTVITAEHRDGIRTAATDTVTDIQAEIAMYRELAAKEEKTGRGDDWEEYTRKAAEASQRLTDSRKASVVSATDFPGSAVLLASLLAVEPIKAMKSIALAKTIAALIVMELLVHLAGAAAKLIGQAMTAQKASLPESHQPLAGKMPESQPRDPNGRFARKTWTKAEDYTKNLEPA